MPSKQTELVLVIAFFQTLAIMLKGLDSSYFDRACQFVNKLCPIISLIYETSTATTLFLGLINAKKHNHPAKSAIPSFCLPLTPVTHPAGGARGRECVKLSRKPCKSKVKAQNKHADKALFQDLNSLPPAPRLPCPQHAHTQRPLHQLGQVDYWASPTKPSISRIAVCHPQSDHARQSRIASADPSKSPSASPLAHHNHQHRPAHLP